MPWGKMFLIAPPVQRIRLDGIVSDRAGDRGQLRNRKRGTCVLFEIDLDQPDPGEGVGLYMIDSGDGLRGRALRDVDDALLDLWR